MTTIATNQTQSNRTNTRFWFCVCLVWIAENVFLLGQKPGGMR
jgi:hypothetical protein